MKISKYIILNLLAFVVILSGCQEDDVEVGELKTPVISNIEFTITGQDGDNPKGDGSGSVIFNVTAENAIGYKILSDGIDKFSDSNEIEVFFGGNTGVNTYNVTVLAIGVEGVSSSKSTEIEVFVNFKPPEELLAALEGTWRIHSAAPAHFGLGDVGGTFPNAFAVGPEEKEGVGMYDDRYSFSINQDDSDINIFEHITNGTVFGREVLIEEIGGPGDAEFSAPADYINYTYPDQTGSWRITGPGGVITLQLSDNNFIGYYIGGDHSYKLINWEESILSNTLTLVSTDGNGEFDWWFILIKE